ncbi:hypothetical protein BSKO_11780 [Bryopsis sp. KO-2023]|nr:hypothetical protein BSKO_11780 [Bryopsis sp. KO-2023]
MSSVRPGDSLEAEPSPKRRRSSGPSFEGDQEHESGSAEFEGVLNEESDDVAKNELPGLVPHYGSGDVEAPNSEKEDESGQVFSLLADYEDDEDEDMEEPPSALEQNAETQQTVASNSDAPKSEPEDLPNGTPPPDLAEESPPPQGSSEKNPMDLPPHLMTGPGASPKDQQTEGGNHAAQVEDEVGSLGNSANEKVLDEGELQKEGSRSANSGEGQSPEPSDACTEELDQILPEEYRQPPVGEVSSDVQETVKSLLEVQLKQNVFFNEEIMVNKQFRNPCFLTKMSTHFGINEFGTLLSPEIYDPENMPKEDMAEGLRAERQRRASTSHISSNPGTGGRIVAPLSAPPGVQNAILQGQRRLREKFTVMAGGKTRPSKWDSGR